MKILLLTCFLGIILFGCNTTQLKDQWKNPDIDRYSPTKVFVVGLTANREARQKFENELKIQLEQRGAQAVMSLDFLEPESRTDNMSETELQQLESSLTDAGFDTVLISKIIGVEDKISYKSNYRDQLETNKNFKDDFLMYQDQFYNPEYYDEYTIYHAETAMYCICPTEERSLIWKGFINITDPVSIDKTVTEYANLVIAILEAQQLVLPITNTDKKLK